MLYFLEKGYRVIAHDRRGHGRSSQVSDGHDMDHYAADAAAVMAHLDLRNAVHVGHSTGGGEALSKGEGAGAGPRTGVPLTANGANASYRQGAHHWAGNWLTIGSGCGWFRG
jgi:hypothetical protein